MIRTLAATLALFVAGAAHAQSLDEGPASEEKAPRFFLRGGPAFATFDASASVEAGGAHVPGGDAKVKNNTGVAFEGGYFFLPNWSVSLTIGVPPTARIEGAGTLASAGKLGTASYGPGALGIQFHPSRKGPFQPYIGGGIDYTLVYHVRGDAIRNLHVTDGYGPFAQAGAEYMLDRKFGVFVDVKKVWVAVDARGAIDTPQGSTPVRSRLNLDPLIANAGVSWHF